MSEQEGQHVRTAILYAEILSTTSLQSATSTEHPKQPPSTPAWLMMGAGATPLSIYLKTKNRKHRQQLTKPEQLMQTPTTKKQTKPAASNKTAATENRVKLL